MKIKQNDEVIVIAGKDKGSVGTVTKVLGEKVIVEGYNLAKKHVRPNPQEGIQGGIEEKEMPMSISNVAIYNPTTKKADRSVLGLMMKVLKKDFLNQTVKPLFKVTNK
jgi:large subunit ribosomal protein L24